MLERVISGGQTGVDQAALDAAIALGIPHGGYCPAGRRSELGPIPNRYRLEETPWADYRYRTRRNVLAADATLLLAPSAELTGGTLYTRRVAKREGRPWMLAVLAYGGGPEPDAARAWALEHAEERARRWREHQRKGCGRRDRRRRGHRGSKKTRPAGLSAVDHCGDLHGPGDGMVVEPSCRR